MQILRAAAHYRQMLFFLSHICSKDGCSEFGFCSDAASAKQRGEEEEEEEEEDEEEEEAAATNEAEEAEAAESKEGRSEAQDEIT